MQYFHEEAHAIGVYAYHLRDSEFIYRKYVEEC